MLVYNKIVLCVDNSHYRGGVHRKFRTFVHSVNQICLGYALQARRMAFCSYILSTTNPTLKGGHRNQKPHSTALEGIFSATKGRKIATKSVKRICRLGFWKAGFAQPFSVKTSKKCCKIRVKRLFLPKKREK